MVIYPERKYDADYNRKPFVVTYDHYSEDCVFIDFEGVRIAAHSDFARAMWSALDAQFSNEGNTREAQLLQTSGHGADGSLVDPEGNVVPFIADHV
jgi:ketosteroid isomerase-like protein